MYFWRYFIGNGDFDSPALDALSEDEERPGEEMYFEDPPNGGSPVEEPPYDGPTFQERHFEEPGVEDPTLDELPLEEPWE